MAGSTCDLSTAAACATAIRRITGCDDVTLLAFRPEADEADRVYSTVPGIFPLFGAKPIPKGKWTTLIIREQRPVLFAGASAIIATFPDHGVILGNGYRAVFNVPVTVAQRCMGSVNCLFFDENPVLDNDEATRRIGELVDLADIFGA